jgi:hypothetical protein
LKPYYVFLGKENENEKTFNSITCINDDFLTNCM